MCSRFSRSVCPNNSAHSHPASNVLSQPWANYNSAASINLRLAICLHAQPQTFLKWYPSHCPNSCCQTEKMHSEDKIITPPQILRITRAALIVPASQPACRKWRIWEEIWGNFRKFEDIWEEIIQNEISLGGSPTIKVTLRNSRFCHQKSSF